MLEPEIADLSEILTGLVTNSESQAVKWAQIIIKKMQEKGWNIVTDDALDGG